MAHLTTKLVIEDKELRTKGTHMAEIKEMVIKEYQLKQTEVPLTQDNPPMPEVAEPMISREIPELLETWEEKMAKMISGKNSEILRAREMITDMIGEM